MLRKPLAYCLGRWAVRELDRLEKDRTRLSKPVRRVLKRAGEMHRFGGNFNPHECPLCERTFAHLVGTTQLRTVAGSAYLCCAAPTEADDALILAMVKIDKKLSVAQSLDTDNTEIPAARARLPDWYRAVDPGASSWAKKVVDDRGNSEGGAGADVAASIIASLLFG